jgi:glycosyltransferase involved in cell wall biosynthesis
MNILEINTMDNRGGAAKVAWQIKTELEKRGDSVSLFVKLKYSNDKNVFLAKWPNALSLFLQKLTGKDIESFLSNKLRPLLANDIEFFGSNKILRTSEFQKADIVHCHNLHGNYWDLTTLTEIAKKKPLIWTLHDMWALTGHCAHTLQKEPLNGFYACDNLQDYQNLPWDNSNHLQKVKKKVYQETDLTIVVPCEWLREKLTGTALAEKRIRLIRNGVDITLFAKKDKQKSRHTLGLPVDKKIVLFSAGSSYEQKGGKHFETIAEKYLNDETILFVSVGGLPPYLHSVKNIRNDAYAKNPEVLAAYYSAADVFLFPSLFETMPLAVLEALSCSLPVVAFDVGGIKEAVVHGKNGYLAKRGATEELEQNMQKVLVGGKEAYETLGSAAREKIVNEFNLENTIKEYSNLYQEMRVS